MQNHTKSKYYGYILNFPDIKLLQFNYCRNMTGWAHPHRTAPFWRFYWNATPGALLLTQSERIELTPEKMVLIPPYTDYASECYQPFEQFYFHFFAETPFDRVRRYPLILSAERGRDFLPYLEQWLLEEPELLPFRLYSIIFDLLRIIPVSLFTDKSEKPLDPRIEEALTIIWRDYQLKLNNSDIAKELNMSLNNFLHLFKREIGISVHQYLLGHRLEKSQMRLAHTLQDIESIAVSVGFKDRYHFSKAFKEKYSITPVEYRRRFPHHSAKSLK